MPKRMVMSFVPAKFNYAKTVLTHRLANKLNLKVADLAAIEGDYYKSISKYESVAKSSVSNNLMKCTLFGKSWRQS